MIIAVDGPAGAGKSTVCRLLAAELGFIYLDTGAMYRAVAWALLNETIDLESALRPDRVLSELPIHFSIANRALTISFRGMQLGEELRRPEMAHWASRISQNGSVRQFLTEWQRRLAAMGDLVAEGRDMTTVVFPNAEVKVFLTASLAVRAQRRLAEYQEKGIAMEYSFLEARMRDRDEADERRSLAPLCPAPGAVVVDTSEMDVSRAVRLLVGLATSKLKNGDGRNSNSHC